MLTSGAKLGPFEVGAKLGQGGMGEVWRATDTRLGRQVALKLLPKDFAADAERHARFEREARVLASLNHPNIATLYGLERLAEIESRESRDESAPAHPEGERVVHALVMELVEGEGLDERIARGPVPVTEVIPIARQIAEALEAAHERGVVHRDLKPANVRVRPDGRVKVLDFGLAKAGEPLSASAGGATGLTHAATLTVDATGKGVVLGTAAYMSPEQARGAPVDRRTDIWSFGVVLYELLSGVRPFAGEGFVETLDAVLHGEVDLSRLPACVPARLRELLERCLERDVMRRLRDIGEARVALERLAAAPSASRVSPGRQTSTEGAVPSVAVLPFVNMSGDRENEYFADGVTEDVIAHLAKVRTLRVISRTSAMAFKNSSQSLREIGAALGVATLLEGSVRRVGNRVRIVAQLVDRHTDEHLWAESYDRQLDDIFAIQTDVALQIAQALRAELTLAERQRIHRQPTADLEAYQLYLQGRQSFLRFTKEGARQSLASYRRAVERDPAFALAHAAMAHSHVTYGIEGFAGFAPADAFARAQEAVARALELDADLAEAHGIVGLLRMVRDFDWRGAEEELRLALALSPGSADLYDHLGWLCSSLRRFEESIAMVRRAHDLDPVAHRSDVANELMRAGRAEEALEEARRGLASDPNFSRLHSVAGWASLALGRRDEAVAALQRAVALAPGSTLFLAQLGQVLAMAGKTARAHDVLAELEGLAAREYVAPYHLAYVHAGLGNADAAMDHLERAYEERAGAIYGVYGSYLFAGLREHPRFRALLAKMNIVPAPAGSTPASSSMTREADP